MKRIISLSAAGLAALLLSGCVENDVMHVGSTVAPSSSAGQAFSPSSPSPLQDDAVARKRMENRTF
jgi:hypothetical protein